MNLKSQYSSVKDRIFGLDLLRAIAIVLVLIAHTIKFLRSSSTTQMIGIYGGVWGVEIFFVLSGFLIGTILIKVHNQEEFTTSKSIKNFWIRRWFRTLPNYYLMLLVYALLYHFNFKINVNVFSYLLFFQNITPNFPHLFFFDVSWSLSVEEWFYLSFPLILFCVQYLSADKFNSLVITLSIFIITPLILRIYTMTYFGWPWDEGFRKVVPLRLDSIAIGVLAALSKFRFPNIWETKKKVLALIGLVLLIFLLIKLKFDFIDKYDSQTDTQIKEVGGFMNTIFFSLSSLVVGLFLPIFYALSQKNNIYKIVITTISIISYSLYLLHPVIIIVVSHFFQAYPIISFVLIWVMSLIGSYIQYNIFEKKFTALRNRFGRKKDVISIL